MDNIIYTTPEEQIEKLKSQNLLIKDENSAKEILKIFGYSNLIKSYREPYIIKSGDSIVYRSGVSFEQIFSLYILDKNLRNIVMASMLDFEEHIKELASDVIASSFGVHQDEYLKYINFKNKRKKYHRYTLPGILETIHKTLKTDKDPISHYANDHGIVPPWILFKSVYLSTMVNFIDLFKISEQNLLINRLYNLSKLNISEEQARKLMMDTLYICLEYRNVAAHGGRIYNYKCQKKLRTDEIFTNEEKPHVFGFGFSQLIWLLSMLNYQNPYEQLRNALNHEVNRHCAKFPQDVTYLGQILNIDIILRKIVFASKSRNIYHSKPHCSGMINAAEMDLDEAIKQGYKPCKRCCY